MTTEIRTIAIAAYRDSDSKPTCAKDFSRGEVCEFYRTQRLGVNETCVFAEQGGRYLVQLARRKDGHGSLLPCADCPVWNQRGRP